MIRRTVDELRARAAYIAYRAGAEAARVVPPALGRRWARAAGRATVYAFPRKRRLVARHLRRITDGALSGRELERTVSVVFEHYARYWHELFRLPDASPAFIASHFDAEGFEHVSGAIDAGRGAILVLPHLGNWDFAGAWLAGRGYRPTVVVEPAASGELSEWFWATRRRLGMEVVSVGPEAAQGVARALQENRVVCLLGDRDVTGNGVEVEFFGEVTRLPAGPATLAFRHRAPLIPVGVYFTDHGGHIAQVLPPIPVERRDGLRADVTRVTGVLARALEGLIRAAPEQWLSMSPNWPSEEPSFGSRS
jgi:KDO2-lipid IV(A) lauroyltransferase